MSRLIDADALIMALRLEYPMMPMFKENQKEWEIKTEGYRKAEEVIKDAPTIEPKRGEWIFKTVFPNDKSEFPMGYLVCSVCGSHHSNSTPCNYCDNCGADMREREGE